MAASAKTYRDGRKPPRKYGNGRSSVAGATRAVYAERRCAALIGFLDRDGDDGLAGRPLHLVDARLVPERGGDRRGEAVDEPLLPIEVVHRKSAPFGQVPAHRGHRLAREEVALQTDRPTAGDERE